MDTTFTFTLGELGLLLICTAAIVLLIYIILLVRSLIPTVKKMNQILDDVQVITHTASETTETLKYTIDNMSESTSILYNAIKGNQNVVSALTSFVNAVTSLKNIISKIFGK